MTRSPTRWKSASQRQTANPPMAILGVFLVALAGIAGAMSGQVVGRGIAVAVIAGYATALLLIAWKQ